MPVVDITQPDDFETLVARQDPSKAMVINFWAEWAASCPTMNAVFDDVSGMYPDHVFLKVEPEEVPELADIFEVDAVPTFVVIQGGKVVARVDGARPAELRAAVGKYMGSGDATPSVQDTKKERPLEERLKELIHQHNVMVFIKGSPNTPRCGFSRQLVQLLRDQGVSFGYFDILSDEQVRQGLKTYSDWPTYPQVYVRGELQGGLDIIKELVASGDFKKMVETST